MIFGFVHKKGLGFALQGRLSSFWDPIGIHVAFQEHFLWFVLLVLPLWRFVPDLPRFAKKCLINDMCFCRNRVFLFLFKMVLARSGIQLGLWVPLESSEHPHDISWAMVLIFQMGLRIFRILP